MVTITKSWRDFPAAHRQPKHDGHCRLIHGHNWGFDITIGSDTLDENGFVVDVGKLGMAKKKLEELFDHTLLINEDDPLLEYFKSMHNQGWCELRVVPNCGMEGLARLVAQEVQIILDRVITDGRLVGVDEVICWEDSKNRATFIP